MRGRTNVGGGGANIDGDTIEAIVKSGNLINSGQFVEIDKTFGTSECQTFIDYYHPNTNMNTYDGRNKTYFLSDGRQLTFNKDSDYINVIITYINEDNLISYFTKEIMELPTGSNRTYTHCVEMEPNKYVLLNANSKEVGIVTYNVEDDTVSYRAIGNGIFNDGVLSTYTPYFIMPSRLIRLNENRFMLIYDKDAGNPSFNKYRGVSALIYDITTESIVTEEFICPIIKVGGRIEEIEYCRLKPSGDFVVKYGAGALSTSSESNTKYYYARFSVNSDCNEISVIINDISTSDYTYGSNRVYCLAPLKDDIFLEYDYYNEKIRTRRITSNGLQEVKPIFDNPNKDVYKDGVKLAREGFLFGGIFELDGDNYFVRVFDGYLRYTYERKNCFVFTKIEYDDEYGISFGPMITSPWSEYTASGNFYYSSNFLSIFEYLKSDMILFGYKKMWRMQVEDGEFITPSQGYVVKKMENNINGVALTGGSAGSTIQVVVPK